MTDDEVQRLLEQLARENRMTMQQFKQALSQQGLTLDSVRESLKRQQIMARLIQYKVKPRRVSDEEVQAAYATMTKNTEWEVRARDIFISAPDSATPEQESAARAKADAALRRIRAGESFAKVARDVSDGPTAKEGGDLGYFRRGQMIAELEEAAFSLQPGGVSGLIRTHGDHAWSRSRIAVSSPRGLSPRSRRRSATSSPPNRWRGNASTICHNSARRRRSIRSSDWS